MGYFRETKINLPKELLEFNREAKKPKRNISIRHLYTVDGNLKRAYENMAEINLTIAEMGMSSDLYSLENYEGELEQNASKNE